MPLALDFLADDDFAGEDCRYECYGCGVFVDPDNFRRDESHCCDCLDKRMRNGRRCGTCGLRPTCKCCLERVETVNDDWLCAECGAEGDA